MDTYPKVGSSRAVLENVQGIILAGGLGTRLRPVVGDKPKVLAEVAGRAFLAHVLDKAAACGLRSVVLCTGYGGEEVARTFGNAYGPLGLIYSYESNPLGTGGALRLALGHTKSDPVLVMNGDSYCDGDYRAFFSWHEEKRAEGSIMVARIEDAGEYGSVAFSRDGRIEKFSEKDPTAGAAWANAGVYLFSRSWIERIDEGRAVSLEQEAFPAALDEGLYAYESDATFYDIGTPERLEKAQAFFRVSAEHG